VAVDHGLDRTGGFDADAGGSAFVQQHPHDQFRGLVAEQLPEFLLVVRDAMALDQLDEVRGGMARQRRLAEMGVGRQVVRWRGAGVGEIAAPAAGHQDLLADLVRVLDHQHPQAALACGERAHEPGCAAADDDGVVGRGHVRRDWRTAMLTTSPYISASPSWTMLCKRMPRSAIAASSATVSASMSITARLRQRSTRGRTLSHHRSAARPW